MKARLTFACLLALAWLAGCSDASKPGATDSDLRGQVVDADGRPVAGATVVLEYAFDSPSGGVPDKPGTGIDFELPEPGRVTLWIGSFCDDDTLCVLLDGELPSGQHMVVWYGRDGMGRVQPDGVYRYHVASAAGEKNALFPLFHLGYQNLPAGAILAPLAVTDARGRFALDQACLPLGFTFEDVDETGQPVATHTILRMVRVWACAGEGGVPIAGPRVTVDPEHGATVSVILGD